MFFGNIRSNDVLRIVNISRSFNGFFSVFVLDNRLSFNSIIIINSVFPIDKSDLQIFFFNNRLDDRLVDVPIGRKRNTSGIDFVFNFSRSENGSEGFLDFSSLFDLELFGVLINSGLDNSLIVSLIARNEDVFYGSFVGIFSGKNSTFSINDLIILLNELRHDLFNLLVDLRLDDNSLSKRFDNLFSHNFGFSNNSFSNDFWVSRVSLSDDFGFHSNILCLYFCL